MRIFEVGINYCDFVVFFFPLCQMFVKAGGLRPTSKTHVPNYERNKGHRYERSKEATRGAAGLTTRSQKLLVRSASLLVTSGLFC